MKLQCTVYGDWCGSKMWHSNDKYRSIVWQYNRKYKIEHPKSIPRSPLDYIETSGDPIFFG